MRAVHIVRDAKVAKVLIDPMRREILDLLREKPMTQTQLARELELSPASLNYHIKLLRSKRLVTIAKKQVGVNGIVEIFYSTVAYYFIYDMESLPNHIMRYFHPLSLERARAVISSLLLVDKSFTVDQTPEGIDKFSVELSRIIANVAKSYEKRKISHGKENLTLEIYNKAIMNLVKRYKL
ncbi:MAG TPA: helix-turn-helix domain-containing protein [Nitrososphaeraceae archaeon]